MNKITKGNPMSKQIIPQSPPLYAVKDTGDSYEIQLIVAWVEKPEEDSTQTTLEPITTPYADAAIRSGLAENESEIIAIYSTHGEARHALAQAAGQTTLADRVGSWKQLREQVV